ncbi:hypothetical protein [Gordonia sp. NPDC003429]
MDNWGVMAGLGLLAATIAVIAYTRSRERDPERLRSGVQLARDLRALAGDDAVRLAAVDEFEVTLYQRLFHSSVVAPRVRAAVWALLAAVLFAAGALATRGDGLLTATVHVAAVVVAILFALAALGFAGAALLHFATTPRVSFDESYENADETADPAVPDPAAPDPTATDD